MPTIQSNLVIAAIFLIGVAVTLWRGPLTAFAFVAIPCMILLSEVPAMRLPLMPDPNATYASMYGIFAGIILRGGEPMTFRWNILDYLVLLLAAEQTISSVWNDGWSMAFNTFGQLILGYVGVYFLARMLFQSAEHRRQALYSVMVCVFIVAFFGLIETRLWPNYMRMLIHRILGMPPISELTFRRYGFFRANAGFTHPIYLGDACMALMGIVAVLASTTAVKLRDWRVRAAIGAAIFALFTSISFGPILAFFCAVAAYLAIRYVRLSRQLLVGLMIGAIVAGFLIMAAIRSMDVEIKGNSPVWSDSLRMRVLILHKGWDFAADSGFLGRGHVIDQEELGLSSVDNSYLLFVMRYGWAYLAIWLGFMVAIAWRVSRALRDASRTELIIPMAAGMAMLFGVMVGMANVWADLEYMRLFLILTAFISTLSEFYLKSPSPRRARRKAVPAATVRLPGEPMIVVSGLR